MNKSISLKLPLAIICSIVINDSYSQTAAPNKIVKTNEEWQKILPPEVYYITREEGTERAFTGKYWNCNEIGTYQCYCCELPLFSSSTKYKSGTGWPSFYQPVKNYNLIEKEDNSNGWNRTEIICARCNAHLGHVFNDGPKPSGLRYCINSAALKFIPSSK